MIVVSLVLFLSGVALLAAGLVNESIALEIASIAAALLSALVLYLAVRQRRPATGSADPALGSGGSAPGTAAEASTGATGATAGPTAAATATPPAGAATSDDMAAAGTPPAGASGDMAVPVQYADEPDEEPVRLADVEWISTQPDVVQVVDGHPRYHVGLCPSLRDQEVFGLPVSEARELGFTPCGRCRPDASILDSAWRSHRTR